MARTKQTARKSMGVPEPRKQLATRAARSSFLIEEDVNEEEENPKPEEEPTGEIVEEETERQVKKRRTKRKELKRELGKCYEDLKSCREQDAISTALFEVKNREHKHKLDISRSERDDLLAQIDVLKRERDGLNLLNASVAGKLIICEDNLSKESKKYKDEIKGLRNYLDYYKPHYDAYKWCLQRDRPGYDVGKCYADYQYHLRIPLLAPN